MTDYTLDTLVHTPDLLLVRLTPPSGGEMQSTRIAFLPGGYIVIHGDLCPGENGLISNGGYGPAWFANDGKPKSPRYMAEKFRVPDVFIPRQAVEYLCGQAADACDRDEVDNFLMLADEVPSDGEDVDSFLESVEDMTGSPDHAEAFYGPDPRTMELLLDIQAAFARLYRPSSDPTP